MNKRQIILLAGAVVLILALGVYGLVSINGQQRSAQALTNQLQGILMEDAGWTDVVESIEVEREWYQLHPEQWRFKVLFKTDEQPVYYRYSWHYDGVNDFYRE